MKRSVFIRLSGLATGALFIPGCNALEKEDDPSKYPIRLKSDHNTAHLVFKSLDYPTHDAGFTDTVIVGGGIAGLSAAHQLKNKDFKLFELSDQLGGSSSATQIDGQWYTQGAHYDLEYPEYYGEEVLQLLEELSIISYNKTRNSWTFIDKQHLIKPSKENLTKVNGKYQGDVLPNGKLKTAFIELLNQYEGEMPLPSRKTKKHFQALNDISFKKWLSDKIPLTPEFIRALDYNMLDDWSGGIDDISALAGIHYYKCRPYYTEEPELFSPKQGNYYFIQKLSQEIDTKKIHTSHLVKGIKKTANGYLVEVIDEQHKQIKQYHCTHVIYAGHKHALKHIYPSEAYLFKDNTYAPWLVANVILKNPLPLKSFWQNEIISDRSSFLGFVNSSAQDSQGPQVLTGYFCYRPEDRNTLLQQADEFRPESDYLIRQINDFLETDITNNVKEVRLRAMGHAMAIPKPGFLFKDLSTTDLIYAGVDANRLPVLFEAIDSGIQAAARVRRGQKPLLR